MKNRFLLPVLLSCSILVFGSPGLATAQDSNAKVSEAETKAAQAVEAAPDINARLLAAGAFVKKYPKSTLRQPLIGRIADQVFDEKDPAQRLTLAQKALTIFTADPEVSAFKPAVIDAYLKLGRFDEAFTEGAAVLVKDPDNIQILVNLAITGTEQAKLRNTKFVPQSRQYGLKGIELIEADKKPAYMVVGMWEKFKATLPLLYQEVGLLSLIQQDTGDAQVKLERAAKLNPADPFNYVLLGSIVNAEYQKIAETYKSMPDGKAKDDLRLKINQLLDKVIDLNAHAVALSEGKAGYEKLHDQTLEDMTPYYKFRHGGSIEGMQKLIDGYKLP